MKTFLNIVLFLLTCSSLQAQWHQVNSNTNENISQMVFADASTGYFVSGHSIFKTTDAGENWGSVFAQNNLDFHSIGITNNEIYAFAKQGDSDKLIKSSNDGNNWEITNIPYYPNDVESKNGKLFFSDWNDNLKLKKIEGSQTSTLSNNSSVLFGINQNEIIIINDTYNTIYKSTDGGENWSALSGFPDNFSDNNANRSQIKSFGDSIVLTASYGASVHLSINNGNTWDIIYDESIPTSNIILDSGKIYGTIGCNEEEGVNLSCITGSTDYGQTWEVIQTGLLGSFIDYNFYFYDNNLGFAYTDDGIIYKTSTGGGLSVEKKSFEPNFQIFPNPAKEELTIHTGNSRLKTISLYNLQGKEIEVDHSEQTNHYVLNTSRLLPGTYFLKIETNQGKKVTKKLVIK